MSKKKIIGIVLLIIFAILLIFIVCTLRKFIIIKNLQKDLEQYVASTNYHIKTIREENGMITTSDYYKKDNKTAHIREININGQVSKLLEYDNGERKDLFIETTEEKVVQLDVNSQLGSGIYDYFELDSTKDFLMTLLNIKIKKADYNGKECYIINSDSDKIVDELIIEKDTGLRLKVVEEDNIITKYEYEFDNVDDSIFAEPDISQYTLK